MNPGSDFRDYHNHVNPALSQLLHLSGRDQRFVKGEGCCVITDGGDRYADWVAGFGALNLGHNPPRLRELIDSHLARSPLNLFPESLNPFAGALAADLVRKAGDWFEICFFANSGSEGVEAALKTAIAATGRKPILYLEGAYHGTTMGALSLMGAGHFREKFEPLLPYVPIPFNNIEALEKALAVHQPAALILEPVQVEAGVRVLNSQYLQQASALCHDSGALLILDEVQTGMGRTGELFAFHQMQTRPDIVVLGKSLGGGLLSLSATLYRSGIFGKAYGDYRSCEIHNSTFGGNGLACVVGLEVLNRIANLSFLESVRERATRLQTLLQGRIRNHPLVERITLNGLLGGIQLRQLEHPWFSWKSFGIDDFENLPVTGPVLIHRMHRRKFLTQICAHNWNTLRIEPPLIVSDSECEMFVNTLREELDWILANV